MPLFPPQAADRLPPVDGPIDPDVSARIDVLRAVLIGLIVVCHGGRWIGSDVPFANPGVEFGLTLVNRGLDCVAVPLFFAIAGFLLLRKLECSATAYLALLRRKFVAIGIPFLIFNAVWIVWLLAVGSIALFGSRSYLLEAGIVAKLFGLGTPPLNYPLWFLRDLLLVFVLTPVFLVFYRRLPVAGLVGLLLLWLVGEPAGEYSLGGFAFAFYAGGFLARRGVNLRDTAGWDKYVLPLFLAGSVLVGASPWLGLDAYQLAAVKKAYQIVGVAGFWCLSRQGWVKGEPGLAGHGGPQFLHLPDPRADRVGPAIAAYGPVAADGHGRATHRLPRCRIGGHPPALRPRPPAGQGRARALRGPHRRAAAAAVRAGPAAAKAPVGSGERGRRAMPGRGEGMSRPSCLPPRTKRPEGRTSSRRKNTAAF